MIKEDELFQKGIDSFNKRKFYDAHEYWEELWLDYKIEDAKFIQALIQLAVSYYHLSNNNLNGAKSMIRKCIKKLENFDNSWGIDVIEVNKQVKDVQNHYNNISYAYDIDDRYIITLKVIHE